VQLGDLQAQPSVSGNAIAIVFGTNVAKGCRVICQSEVRIVTETDDGKGSGTEVENEVAYQDFTIEVCESSELRGTSVSAILVVWQDGQIVYDVRPDPLISNAESEKWKRGVTFYYGAEDQEPDPTEESYLGVGQIPAYRGKCRMVFDNRNISKYGNRIPNFECLVSSCATVVETGGGIEVLPPQQSGWKYLQIDASDATDYSAPEFDDSSWSTGAAPFGSWEPTIDPDDIARGAPDGLTLAPEFDSRFAQEFATEWDYNTRLWLRRTFSLAAIPEEGLQITSYMDDNYVFYINGDPVVVSEFGLPGGGGATFPISSDSLVVGENVIAIRCSDEAPQPEESVVYADFIIEYAGAQDMVELPDVPDYYVDTDGGTVYGPTFSGTPCATTAGYITQKVAEFCGIPDAEIVTTEIDGIAVRGYTIQSNVSGRGAIDPLCRTFFYDVPEFDGAIRCHVRGSVDVDAVIDTGEMLDLDSDEDEDQTRGQQVEYPRKHHLRYIASDVDYVFTDAISERTSPDIRVVGETSIEAPVAMTSDEAAKVANIQHKVVWTEREDIRKFGIPLENIELVGASILEVEDRRFRLDDYRIEDGAIFVERAAYDRVSAYSSNATGPVANPTNPPPSTLIGPTIGAAMNLPALRVEDDRLGLYFAGTGLLDGWRGYSIETATDVAGEYTVRNSAVLSRATIGVLTAALPTADRDYTDVANTLSVRLYAGELNSIEELAFHNGGNAAAILYADGTAEIVNFRDAVETAPLEYDLTTLLRGRLDTDIATHAIGAMFVLLNNALRFVDLTPADLGQTITYRLASLGTTRADNAPNAITVDTFESQREWSVTNIEAERDVSDNVTVTWDGRPALGTNVQPQHHAQFVGYQVTYSDGVDTFTKMVARTPMSIVGGIVVTDETTTHTYTASEQTTDFGSVPGSLDIEVSAINSLAGAGPSTGTTV
jgi:hypothetical protein